MKCRNLDSRKIGIPIDDADTCSIQDDTITRICFVDGNMGVPPVHEDSLVVDRNVEFGCW